MRGTSVILLGAVLLSERPGLPAWLGITLMVLRLALTARSSAGGRPARVRPGFRPG